MMYKGLVPLTDVAWGQEKWWEWREEGHPEQAATKVTFMLRIIGAIETRVSIE